MLKFSQQSTLTNGALALALSSALTPNGIIDNPQFFTGYALYPQILARCLLVLADITATRYFKPVPVALRDPILSAQGDQLRAEVFSACNSVYARLDLLQQGFDGQILRGTTNVDIGLGLRQALNQVNSKDKLHLNIGEQGLATRHIQQQDHDVISIKTVVERPVEMPDRWIRALGNLTEIHTKMAAVFTVAGIHAQTFIARLPAVTSKQQASWVVPSNTGVKLASQGDINSVYISGLHRLSALKRLMTNIKSLTFYRLESGEQGPCMVEVALDGARLTLSLTAQPWQGYSGEGALLESLVPKQQLQNVQLVQSILQFDSQIDPAQLSSKTHLDARNIDSALAYLAVSGKLGFDAYQKSYFHRQLPEDPNRVIKDNPRLKSAYKLVEFIDQIDETTWIVHSNDEDYQVRLVRQNNEMVSQCNCSWYLNHQLKKGPCKHILAVQIKENIYEC
ncbi:hypothetical protein A9G28_03850 [Gilliamella sp. Fer1-1]|nr:hypothetical protein A9G47_10390 [Gilliamella apicola]OCG43441.1 hypothetical protein A9G28_03850 [Gilliamella apicola]